VQRGAIKFCVKLKETTTETFEMLKSAHGGECLSRANVFEWHEKGEGRFKTMERKPVLQLPEQKNRRKSLKNIWPKIEV
jgi:hypothetical protein